LHKSKGSTISLPRVHSQPELLALFGKECTSIPIGVRCSRWRCKSSWTSRTSNPKRFATSFALHELGEFKKLRTCVDFPEFGPPVTHNLRFLTATVGVKRRYLWGFFVNLINACQDASKYTLPWQCENGTQVYTW
jgi:hypothetical protein